MQSKSAVARSAPHPTGLRKSQVLGGRFEITEELAQDAMGVLFRGTDQKTGKPLRVRGLPPELLKGEEAVQALKAECRQAAQLKHRNIVAVYAVGSATGRLPYVATEWLEGQTLEQLVRKRHHEDKDPLSLRGAYNVVAHVSKALSHAHATTHHGGVRPEAVWVTASGRVKVDQFGLVKSLLQATGPQALGPADQGWLAPEIKAGKAATVRSDVFGTGALLYYMLSGRTPTEAFTPPSQEHPEATPAVDEVLLRALSTDPQKRFETVEQLRDALLPLIAKAPVSLPPPEDLGVDIELDIDVASLRPAPAAHAAPAPAAHAAPAPHAPASSPSEHNAKAQPGPKPSAPPARGAMFEPPTDEAAAPTQSVASGDLEAALATITTNDAHRWMVVKDKLDHGPFSGRELVDLILKGEVLEHHKLMNMDTGERQAVNEHPEFNEFAQEAKARREKEQQEAALVQADKKEQASNRAKILVISAGAIGVLAAAAGATYLIASRQSADTEVADAKTGDLFKRGRIEIKGSAGILPDPPRGRRRRGRTRSRSRGGTGGMSYEEAMNQAVSMGDVTSGGGERRLSPTQVAGVMNRNVGKLSGCVAKELRRNSNLGKVQIDFAIAGSGKVLGASVRQGSSSFKKCIASRTRSVRFPSFPAPRMGARYTFSVN